MARGDETDDTLSADEPLSRLDLPHPSSSSRRAPIVSTHVPSLRRFQYLLQQETE
jgi:hypothetical protein